MCWRTGEGGHQGPFKKQQARQHDTTTHGRHDAWDTRTGAHAVTAVLRHRSRTLSPVSLYTSSTYASAAASSCRMPANIRKASSCFKGTGEGRGWDMHKAEQAWTAGRGGRQGSTARTPNASCTSHRRASGSRTRKERARKEKNDGERKPAHLPKPPQSRRSLLHQVSLGQPSQHCLGVVPGRRTQKH